jgi:NhaC family Na+:H+ antiporter
MTAAVLSMTIQGLGLAKLFEYGFSGYVSASGDATADKLFSAGGIESMMFSVSLVLCAMMFGGIMEKSGLMDALLSPLFNKISEAWQLIGVTVISCGLINVILPEQFIAIGLPGRMFAAEYDRHGLPRRELTRALGAGGAALSPLVPWNTCGVFMSGVLGVSTSEYCRWAFLNLMIPFAAIVVGYFSHRPRKKNSAKSQDF